jgi:hypothetical protein
LRRSVGTWISVAALLGVLGGSVGAENLPPTHSMALDAVAETVAGDLLAGIFIPPGRPIALSSTAPGDTLGLLTQRLVEHLRARGVVVRLTSPGGTSAESGSPGSTGTPGASGASDPTRSARLDSSRPLRLDVHVDGSGVSYVRRLGAFPFGTKGYERLAGMRASITLVDPVSGDVIWAKSSTRSATDFIRKKDVAYAASGSGRLNPPVPSGGTRWLEPLIVVGVVAGLVVLFYSNRN